MKKQINLIIDTDIGDDIDDVLALLLVLKEDVNLLGVVSAYQNTNLRARQLKKALHLAHRDDIPVYAGYGKPLYGHHFQGVDVTFDQYEKTLEERQYSPINDHEGSLGMGGVNFIAEQAKKYKNDLTLLTIGPMTNVALALKKSESVKDVHLIMMGGKFFSKGSEWNIECDEAAARICFSSIHDITAIGLDVTNETALTPEEESRLLDPKGDELDQYRAWCVQAWKNFSHRTMVLHDPLAAYAIFHPESLTFVTHRVSVGIESPSETSITNDQAWSEVKIAQSFNREKIVKNILDKICD